MSVYAVVPAAGKGKRLGTKIPKTNLPVMGKPLFIHTLRALKKAYPFREIVLVVDIFRIAQARNELVRHGLGSVWLTSGGATRAESVRNGLSILPAGKHLVTVHDAARPLVSREVVRRTVAAAKKGPSTGSGRCAGAICAVPISSTVKRIDLKKGTLRGTEDRRELVLAQTPQVFDRTLLLARYEALGAKAFEATDEAALFDGTKQRVRVVEGDERNLKVTTKNDLESLKKSLRNSG